MIAHNTQLPMRVVLIRDGHAPYFARRRELMRTKTAVNAIIISCHNLISVATIRTLTVQ